MIAEELRKYLVSTAPEQRIGDVRIGARYTAAMLEDGNVGVAYTFRERAAADPSVFTGRQSPIGRTTAEILEYLGSADGIARTMGLAVANALANRHGTGQHEADVLHVLSVGFLDQVGMVGYFGPLVAPLEKRVRELVIFERDASRARGVRPAEEAFVELRRCDVAIITSTALIFSILLYAVPRLKIEGMAILLYLSLYSAGRFFISIFRVNKTIVLGLREAQIIALAIIVLAIPAALYLWHRAKQAQGCDERALPG
jgi:uncharacterized protein (DUF4213/DUF364 family)